MNRVWYAPAVPVTANAKPRTNAHAKTRGARGITSLHLQTKAVDEQAGGRGAELVERRADEAEAAQRRGLRPVGRGERERPDDPLRADNESEELAQIVRVHPHDEDQLV